MASSDMVAFIAHRYGTANPFTITEKLNVELQWADLESTILGKTIYVFDQPIVVLDNYVKHDVRSYFVMAHELGHVLLHEGLASYYRSIPHGDDKAEYEADKFAETLLILLYSEEHHELPDCYDKLVQAYGFPAM